MAAGDWFVTPLWQPQYLNDIHDMRPLDDQLGVFPPPDRASLVAHRAAFSRLPERTCDVLARKRERDGRRRQPRRPRPAGRGRQWMGRSPGTVRNWLG
jgi:glycine betaine/proline transport system substrate-binding protein